MKYEKLRVNDDDTRIRCVGHPTASIGMGEHVRSVWHALKQAGREPVMLDIYGPQGKPDANLVDQFLPHSVEQLGQGVNIFCINGDEVEQALRVLNNRDAGIDRGVNVIYPAWELERYPKEWAAQLSRFDEVWAPSAFIATAIEKTVDIPVKHMPLACEIGKRALRSRRFFGIRESAYVFMFSFDFLSYVERKNPFGVLAAFKKLIEVRPFADAVLLIKMHHSDKRPEMKARMGKAIAHMHDRVHVIDDTLSDLDMKALMWLTDCYVSLHRSEGFGRGLSEAMTLGKPVIATAYSGNLEFCTEDTALLVPYALKAVKQNEYPHWQDQHWAEPDVLAAAQHMISLVENPAAGRALGARARHHLTLNFSYLAAGLRYSDRITEIDVERAANEPLE